MQENYYDLIFQIVGENIKPNPQEIFKTPNVYLLIDKPLQIIWIWAGSKSRLFHRYIAANWAGKLKSRKEYNQFKYEVIKEDREPKAFRYIMDEIKSGSSYSYPGESREIGELESVEISPSISSSSTQRANINVISKPLISKPVISKEERTKLKTLLSEIKEIHSHVRYSINHIEKRIEEIERIIKKI
ncbi:MAG: hypothetical protein ACFFBP_15650 [Promethearchaeota archaeon]